MTSYFQDGGHDVSLPLPAAASARCSVTRRARVTSLARYILTTSDIRRSHLLVKDKGSV